MPIRDFLADGTGDFAIVDGDFALAGGDTVAENHQAVAQGIATRTRFFLGECFLDESKGVDWLGKILVKNPNPTIVTSELTAAITETPDVVAVQVGALVQDPATRAASIPYTVQDTYSANPISGTASPPLVPKP